MNVIHALQPLPKSIFLAGPTPRDEDTPTWRPEALDILRDLGFAGTVYVPENDTWSKHDRYDDQIVWEWEALSVSSAIVFWVPRDLTPNDKGQQKMPAFTTNVEFGLYARSGKCLMGSPMGAPKMDYLNALARECGIPIYTGLREVLEAAVARTSLTP
ncbi:hypothetical protein HFO56_02685 [Rhizobium laguerreae]|uniref:nucleoside 2-deoxyribosyltransferase domain-containing protein n=1 Tax=Rhizobium laguerreae TaxID=1076926 RepID=UPI001C910156|nr:nucleoside 2-deoxyribosyltransferase domain-containing protein [Rhizobium laguerreae]MBY3151292.1 hypothetical protein [Rhizobium laguerreae]